MDVHPQLFDRHKTLLLEPLVGHAGLSGQRLGLPPRLWSYGGTHVCPASLPEADKLRTPHHGGALAFG